MLKRHRQHGRWAIAVAFALVLGACGTRLKYTELEAAASGTASSKASETSAGDTTAVGTGTATGDTGVGASTGASAGTGAGTASSGGAGAGSPSASASGANEAAAPSGAATCAPKCSPLVIGTVGTYSGIVGQNVVGGVRALQAWAQAINAKGGLNGHKVQVVVADDTGDPARHRALLQQLVEEQHVVAFVYNAAPLTGQASVDYLNKVKIPVIGTEDTGEWSYQSPFYFPQASSGLAVTAAAFGFPGTETKVGGLHCSDGVQVCENQSNYAAKYAPQFGRQLVYAGSGSLAAPDYTAQCLAARGAGAEVIIPVMDGNAIQRIARSCASVGYHPKINVGQPSQNDAIAADPNFANNYGFNLTAPASDTSNPSVVAMRQTMAQYAPGISLTGSPMQGWVAAKLLEAAGPSITEPPTPESIMKGLYALRANDLGGLTMPLTFTPGKTAPRTVCWWPLVIKGGQFAPAGPRQCRDDIKL
jgi:branched-chain amino acid transport system substrate-binding protein